MMAIGAVVLAALALFLDRALVDRVLPAWTYAGEADGTRALLSTVAGSMVTVAGLGFSITIVALVLASTQFGPRLLSLFMRDVTSQLTLGVFVGTFTYCVVVLRTIRDSSEGADAFVPQIAVTIAIGLTLLSVGALIYFFHHVAVSIQAPELVAKVARDVERAIDNLYPHEVGVGGPAPAPGAIPTIDTDFAVAASVGGYVQIVDDAELVELATRHDPVCQRADPPRSLRRSRQPHPGGPGNRAAQRAARGRSRCDGDHRRRPNCRG
jgi:uncharacterized membrane protein